MFAVDDDMIRCAIFKSMHADEYKLVLDISEPEAASIEQMRAEIGQDASAPIPPSRIAHEPRRAVAIKHPAGIDRPEFAGCDQVAHAHEVRLEPVVIGCIANNPVLACKRFELSYVALMPRPQRLLHQDVLAVFEAIREKLDLGLIGDARQHRVVVRKWNIDD